MFLYKKDKKDMVMTFQFHGDLDIEATEIIEEEIIPALEDCNHVEFDFNGVAFVDSTGIGLLIHLIEIVKKNGTGTQIKIKNVQPLVSEVFEMLELGEILGDKDILSLE